MPVLNVNGVLFPVTFVAFQAQPVGVLVLVSLNWTEKVSAPEVTLEVKSTMGRIAADTPPTSRSAATRTRMK